MCYNFGIHTIEEVPGLDNVKRCSWCNMNNPLYVEYHDREWGVFNFDEGYLFEMLLLESFQAGLSWECVLNKRESFRQAFDGFDPHKIACYAERKTDDLMSNPGIIRNRRKIEAAVNNSRVFLDIAREFGSFGSYLRGFTKGETLYECGNTTNPLSDGISKDLKKRGMKFVGSTIIYSYLQAIGVIHSHDRDCYLYKGE
jgi:DNA-3-methyladenine glycosylase I